MLKKLLTSLFAAALSFQAQTGSASVMVNWQEDFLSGAQFNGELTFSDSFDNLLAVSGLLTGGPYGSIPITWVWYAGTGQGGSVSSAPGIYSDFMMDGTPDAWSHHIGISWQAPASGSPRLIDGSEGIYFNQIDYIDPVVRSQVIDGGNVPEPASLALVGLGLAGLAALRRRVV